MTMQKKIIFGIIIISLLAASAFSQDRTPPVPQPPQPPKEGDTMPPPPRPENPEPPMRKDFYNYRGIRRNITDYPIEIIVADLRTPENKRNKSGELELYVRFNQTIDPKSFSTENILINQEETPYEGKIIFNKNSDSVTLRFDDEEDAEQISQVEFKNIVSMDGKRCEILVIKSIKIRK